MAKKSELPKHLKGKYVTRAAFAKMQGEKQRLEKDIYTLVMGSMQAAIFLKMEYRKKYEKDKQFVNMLKELLKNQHNPAKPKLDSNPKAFK
jgi:hypothetical protein